VRIERVRPEPGVWITGTVVYDSHLQRIRTRLR